MKEKPLFFGPVPAPEKVHVSLNKINFFDIDQWVFEIMDRCVDDWARIHINPHFKYSSGSRMDEEQWLLFMSDVYSMYDFRYRKRPITPQPKESFLDD